MESIISYPQIIQSYGSLPKIALSRTQRWGVIAVALGILAAPIILPTMPEAFNRTLMVMFVPTCLLLLKDVSSLSKATETEYVPMTKDVEKVCQCDIILRLKAKADHNGALDLMRSTNIQKIKQDGNYELITLEVESVQGIVSAIEQMSKQGNRIKTLYLHLHGSPRAMQLSEIPSEPNWDDLSFISNLEPLKPYCVPPLKKAFSLLEEDATIIMQSCSTGNIDSEGTVCMAQTLAGIAEGRKVFAPICKSSASRTELVFSETGIEALFYPKQALKQELREYLYSASFEYYTACFRDMRPKETPLANSE